MSMRSFCISQRLLTFLTNNRDNQPKETSNVRTKIGRVPRVCELGSQEKKRAGNEKGLELGFHFLKKNRGIGSLPCVACMESNMLSGRGNLILLQCPLKYNG